MIKIDKIKSLKKTKDTVILELVIFINLKDMLHDMDYSPITII